MLKRYCVFAVAVGLVGLLPSLVLARSTVVSGGVSGGYDYSERNYDINQQNEDEASSVPAREDDKTSRVVITPHITIVSEAPRDTVTFEYAPSVFYDFEESDHDLNQRLLLDYQRFLTRQWAFKLGDTFVDTDDFNSYGTPEGLLDKPVDEGVTSATPVQEDRLRDESGRRRYYTNNLVFSTEYTYLEDSLFSLGYGWNILRNDADKGGENYEDYDKHDFNTSITHRINSQWSTSAYARYIIGDYDSSGDEEETGDNSNLKEYYAGLSLASEFVQHHPVTLSYDFSMTDYDQEGVDNSEIHNLNLGYQWRSTPRLQVSFGAGPTYTKSDDDNDSWDVNGYLAISYKLERGAVSFSSNGGTEFSNFSGTGDRGNARFWQTRADLSYELLQDLTLGVYAYYRDETRDELVPDESAENGTSFDEFDSRQYAAGTSLGYSFYENYSLALSYGYVQQTSDRPDDEYDDHRIQLTLSYQDDFFKW